MKFLPEGVSAKLARPMLHLQKQSPQVMFAAGLVGVVASTVLASRATLSLSDKLQPIEELKARSEGMHDAHKLYTGTETAMTPEIEGYDDKTYAKDQAVLRVKAILAVTKHYAPAAGLMLLSIGLLTGSHVTLNRRNASLTAAYASVDQAFEKYRERVVERLGKDADDEFRHGTTTVKETVEGDDGKKKTVSTKTADFGNKPSLYAKFFDEACNDWKRNSEYNRAFLQSQQNYANQRLRTRGHLFLNEVYDSLGIERTKEGVIVGWVLDGNGDGFVDFGIFDDLTNPHVRDFVNGREYSILLDFNVDGVIYDKI